MRPIAGSTRAGALSLSEREQAFVDEVAACASNAVRLSVAIGEIDLEGVGADMRGALSIADSQQAAFARWWTAAFPRDAEPSAVALARKPALVAWVATLTELAAERGLTADVLSTAIRRDHKDRAAYDRIRRARRKAGA